MKNDMEIKDPSVDYYKILHCEKTSSSEDLKKSYQRLALTLHPDKTVDGSDHEFLLIQEAWSVLRDPESRKQYDAERSCREHNDLLLYDTVSLSQMELNADERTFRYGCRCGGTYLLEERDSMPSSVIIGCDECSFSIQVNL